MQIIYKTNAFIAFFLSQTFLNILNCINLTENKICIIMNINIDVEDIDKINSRKIHELTVTRDML